MEIPPGVLYLCFSAPTFFLPSVLVFGTLRLAQQYLITIPTWAAITASIFARPALYVVKNVYTSFSDKRDAAARGAVFLQQVPDRWGVATLKALVKTVESGYPGDIFLDWSQKLGMTYTLNVVGETRVFTSEPDHIKMILATQFDNYEKGPMVASVFSTLLGTGIFSSDGDMWKFHRSITRPYFTKDRISDFDIFHEHADDVINQAKIRLAEGYPIDFQDVVSRFTLDSATAFLFGQNVQSLSAGLAYPESSPLANSPSFVNHPSNIFADAFLEAQYKTNIRGRYGKKWPLTEFWKDIVKPHRTIINQLVDPIVEKAFSRKFEGGKASLKADLNDEDGKLLDYLVSQTDDTTVVKDELVNLLVAGRDTTAATLTFAMYMLAEHPDVTQRLREEILNRVGSTNRPTYEDLREMKYLRAFINEILRLYPPVPFNGRTSKDAIIWPSKTPGVKPIYIPAETRCTYSVLLMHRRTDLWGPDALEFDPDRFLDERAQKYLVPNPFIFLPFNAGPRICLGQQFAYNESSFFLVRLLQSFSGFTLASDAQPAWSRPPASWSESEGLKGKDKISFGIHLTMYVKGGLWVRMEEAKEEALKLAI